MAQLIFGSSLYPQRTDQMSKKNWKTSHLAMQKIYKFEPSARLLLTLTKRIKFFTPPSPPHTL